MVNAGEERASIPVGSGNPALSGVADENQAAGEAILGAEDAAGT